MKRLFLRVVGGKDNGSDIPVPAGRFVIGRDDEANFRPQSDLVSRQHCAIHFSNDELIIEDLESRNGSFVNGERIEGKQVACSGSTLRIGSLLLELVVKESTDSAKETDSSDAKLGKTPFGDFMEESRVKNDAAQSPNATLDANRVLNKFFDRNNDSSDAKQ